MNAARGSGVVFRTIPKLIGRATGRVLVGVADRAFQVFSRRVAKSLPGPSVERDAMPKITLSQFKIYAGVIVGILIGIWQIVHGDVATGGSTLAAALALLGIGGQTAVTRAILDPRIESPPGVKTLLSNNSADEGVGGSIGFDGL